MIRAATAAGFFHDGQLWMDALDTRNKTSHKYRQQLFDEVIPKIVADFEPMFSRFARDFQNR